MSVLHFYWSGPYISFCETVARNLDIGSHDVAVIGSARIGFSLAPDKYGEAVRPGSDVDTVVVSERIFNEGVMQIIRCVAESECDDIERDDDSEEEVSSDSTIELPRHEWQRLQTLARNVQWGFIAPNFLPDGDDFKQYIFSALNEVATQLLAMKPPGPVWKVRCRIFRTWKEAESHYASSLRRLRRDLRPSHGGTRAAPIADEGREATQFPKDDQS